jgi:hypothetical protein
MKNIGSRMRSQMNFGFLFVMLLLLFTPYKSRAAETLSPVFIKTACNGKISSMLLSSLRDVIGNSQKYRVTTTLTDDNQMDVVLTINIDCTERGNAVALASVFGQAKCFQSSSNCHFRIDVWSLRSDLCDANSATECARKLFRRFSDYVSNPIAVKKDLERD